MNTRTRRRITWGLAGIALLSLLTGLAAALWLLTQEPTTLRLVVDGTEVVGIDPSGWPLLVRVAVVVTLTLGALLVVPVLLLVGVVVALLVLVCGVVLPLGVVLLVVVLVLSPLLLFIVPVWWLLRRPPTPPAAPAP